MPRRYIIKKTPDKAPSPAEQQRWGLKEQIRLTEGSLIMVKTKAMKTLAALKPEEITSQKVDEALALVIRVAAHLEVLKWSLAVHSDPVVASWSDETKRGIAIIGGRRSNTHE